MKKRGVARAYLYNARSRGEMVSKLMVVIGNERPQKREAQVAMIMIRPFTRWNGKCGFNNNVRNGYIVFIYLTLYGKRNRLWKGHSF